MNFQPTANVVLIAPEIPQNTGNLIRLCTNVGARLHLVKPLGFQLENPKLRRASLDYGDIKDIKIHASTDEFFKTVSISEIYGTMVSGNVLYNTPQYKLGDTIVFGSESVGLPGAVINKLKFEHCVRIPMMPTNRSLNISNAAAIIVYEMWRQTGFSGASQIHNSKVPAK